MQRLTWILFSAILLAPMHASAVAGVDLSTTVPIVGEPLIYTDRPTTINAVLVNDGDQASPAFSYQFALSEDRTCSGYDFIIYHSEQVAGLGAYAQRPVSNTFEVPRQPEGWAEPIPEGEYYLCILLDPERVTGDVDLKNNQRRSEMPSMLRYPAPDLTTSEVRISGTAVAGENLSVSFMVENRGNEPATFEYGVYLSVNDVISPDDLLLFMREITLDPGAQQAMSDYVHLSGELPAGTYRVGVVLDPSDAVRELDEHNNARGSAVLLDVISPALALKTSYIGEAVVGVPFSWRLASVGGTGGYSYHVVSGELPPGLSLDGATGEISGIATATGEYDVILETRSGGLAAAAAFTLLVSRPTVSLEIQTEWVPPVPYDTFFDTRLSAVGGVPPYTWTASGLPGGLSLEPNGVLSGVASVLTSAAIDFQVQDARGSRVVRRLTINVVDRAALSITTGVLPLGQAGQGYIAAFGAMGGTQPVAWSVAGGELPKGMSLEASTGLMSGTPQEIGRFEFDIRARDATGLTDKNSYALEIIGQPLVIVTSTLDAATVGMEYEQSLAVTSVSGLPPFQWSILSGELPDGLTLDREQGTLSGIPTPGTGGTYTVAFTVTDSRGATARKAFVLEVIDPMIQEQIARQGEPEGCSSAQGRGGFGLLLALGFGAALALRRRRGGLAALALAVLVLPHAAEAQNWHYAVSKRAAPFVPVTDGQTVTPTNLDDSVTLVDLPFTFLFYGVAYNSIGIDTNGLIIMGHPNASYTSNVAIPYPGWPNGFVAGWWDDLEGTEGSTLKYKSSGASPNRSFVVEYRNWKRADGAYLNFQIRLFERTNKIEVAYGELVRNGLTDSSATVGIESPDGLEGLSALSCLKDCKNEQFPVDMVFTYSTLPDILTLDASAPSVIYGLIPAQVNVTMTNVGGENAGAFEVGAYLSLDSVLGGSDQLLQGRATVSGLQREQTREVSFLITPPGTVQPGAEYYLFIVPNVNGAVLEAGNDNNASRPLKVKIGPPTPNLRAGVPTLGASRVQPGGQVDVQYVLENTGNLAVTASYRIVLSNNAVISTQDMMLHEASMQFDPGVQRSQTTSVTIPADVLAGPYYVGVFVDPDLAVAEPSDTDNAAASASTLLVAAPAGSDPVFGFASLPPARLGQDYQYWLVGTGGDGTYRWYLGSEMMAPLPPGLSLTLDGLIHGRPTAAGDYRPQLMLQSGNRTQIGSFPLTVEDPGAPLTLVTGSLPDGVQGSEYAVQLVSTGGESPYTWSIPSDDLPPGLALDRNGLFGGVPLTSGEWSLTATVEDAQGVSKSMDLGVRVLPPGNVVITSTRVPAATLGLPYSASLQVAGGEPPYDWVVLSGSRLPKGLVLTDDGVLEGTPTQVGHFDFQVQVADKTDRLDTNVFSLTVGYDQGVVIATELLPPATVNEPYRARLTAVNGTEPYTWAVVDGGRLPSGLGLDPNTGLISGMATAGEEGVTPFIVEVWDASGRRNLRGLSIRVAAAPAVRIAEGCSSALGGGSLLALGLAALAVFRRRR